MLQNTKTNTQKTWFSYKELENLLAYPCMLLDITHFPHYQLLLVNSISHC